MLRTIFCKKLCPPEKLTPQTWPESAQHTVNQRKKGQNYNEFIHCNSGLAILSYDP